MQRMMTANAKDQMIIGEVLSKVLAIRMIGQMIGLQG
jgi:hypothetical protein